MPEPKKKRGRKPKNLIQSAPNKPLKMKIDNNLIIRVKINNDKNTNTNELLPGYVKDTEYPYQSKKEYKCWNCFHSIDQEMKSIPLKYDNNIFFIYGHFCTLGCSLRYILENFNNNELWSKYELFNFYCRKLYNQNIEIPIPPNKFALKEFGGNLTIEEYRSKNEYKEINMPIIIPVKNQYQKKNILNFKNTGDLKLYRRPKKEKTIISNMKI
jgi:hypothetical protein